MKRPAPNKQKMAKALKTYKAPENEWLIIGSAQKQKKNAKA